MAIIVGNEFVFASGSTEIPVVRALSDDKFVVAWRDAADADNGKMRIGTRSGINITYGPTLTFASGVLQTSSNYPYARRTLDVAVLDENNVFVTYAQSTQYAYSLICTVSGEVLTSGTSYIYTGLSNKIQCVACSAFTNDKVFWTVDYENAWNDQYIHARVADISGTTISLGTDDSVDVDYVDHIRATTIADDRVMATWSYQRLSSTKRIRAMIYTRSGTTLTRGSYSDLYNATASTFVPGENEPVLLSSGTIAKLAVAYNWSYDARIAYISVSGTTITVNDESLWNSDTITLGALLLKNSETFYLVHRDATDGNSGKIARSKIIDEMLSYDDATTWHSATMSDHHATILEYPFAVIAYRDTANNNYGTALIVQLPIDAQMNLYIQAPTPFSGTSPLYIVNIEEISGSCALTKPGAHRHFASSWHPHNWHLRLGHENE